MLEQFISKYGLLAVFVGVALEGDATMILAGVAAHLRLLGVLGVFFVGLAGSWVGDVIWYAAGRFASGYFKRKIRLKTASERIDAYTRRFGVWSIFFSRFIWGTRILTMSFWGYHRLSFFRFSLVDLVGCFLWTILVGGLGYFFSKSAEVLIGEVRRLEIWLLIAIIGSIILAYVINVFFKGRRSRIQ